MVWAHIRLIMRLTRAFLPNPRSCDVPCLTLARFYSDKAYQGLLTLILTSEDKRHKVCIPVLRGELLSTSSSAITMFRVID